MEITFVILRHIKDDITKDLWLRCHKSIRSIYPFNKIIIIDDNSLYFDYTLPDKNTRIIKSHFPSRGELLPYFYFLNLKWSDKMVFLHDSMILAQPISPNINNNFFWYVGSHKWNKDNHILELIKYLDNKDSLIELYKNTTKWFPCFGCTMIINYNSLKQMNEKFNFINLINVIKTREQRSAFERVLSLMCFSMGFITLDNMSICGNIQLHPFFYQSYDINNESNQNIIKQYIDKNNAVVIKTWYFR